MSQPRSPADLIDLVGKPIDLAPFGRICWWRGKDPAEIEAIAPDSAPGGWLPAKDPTAGAVHIGLEWEEVRDIYSVTVTYAPETAPDPKSVAVQYWQHAWPQKHRDTYPGARRGWIGKDDHYHGQWVTGLAAVEAKGDTHTYTFYHLDSTEAPSPQSIYEAEDFLPEFRKTLKIRLLFTGESRPVVAGLQASSEGVWKRDEVDVFGVSASEASAYNGYVISVTPSGEAARVSFLHTGAPADSDQKTVITVRDGEKPFSFNAAEALAAPIYVSDLGVVVRAAGDPRTPEEIMKAVEKSGGRTIYERVFEEPEQTLQRAMAETPRLRKALQTLPRGRYVPVKCEGSRQGFALRYNGNVFVHKGLLKLSGLDLVDCYWSDHEMRYRFASGDWPDFRENEDGCEQRWGEDGVPVVTTTWVDRCVEYTQTCFAAYLREGMGEPFAKRGDEDIALFVRFNLRNTAHDPATAHLWLQIAPWESLVLDDGVVGAAGKLIARDPQWDFEVLARADRADVPMRQDWALQGYKQPLIRCRVDHRRGESRAIPLCSEENGPHAFDTAVHYAVDLRGGESEAVTVVIPFVTLRGEDGKRLLRSLDYEAKFKEVVDFWKPFAASGARMSVPDKPIQDFFHKVPVHVALTAQKDPGSGQYILPAATFSYGACGNEAVIQIMQLDYRGLHAQAEKYLDGLLFMQGSGMLDGRFKTSEGALAGVNHYNGVPWDVRFNYNLDHGFILWCLSEHYLLTRDKNWLKRTVPNIIAGCDFVTRERQATMVENDGQRAAEYGLLPAGHLEDNHDWRYWFANNAHAYRGIKLAAQVLAEIDHPEAARLAADAAAYKADILAAVERARIESPVARLPDGSYIPHIPIRTGVRGPEWGWFREGAYGPLHMVDGELWDPWDENTTFVLKYLEDCVFPTRQYGRPIDMEKRWFSQAGVTIQANLLNNGVAYLKRDQIEHAVRAMYNDFAVSVYPDVLVFTEHPVLGLGRGVGPYLKTPDECGFLNTLRHLLLHEQGDTLWMMKGAPRSWLKPGETVELRDAATYFGPVSFRVDVSENAIHATITPPKRSPPKEVVLRLRRHDRRPMKKVTVDGKPHGVFDPAGETITLPPLGRGMTIEVGY